MGKNFYTKDMGGGWKLTMDEEGFRNYQKDSAKAYFWIFIVFILFIGGLALYDYSQNKEKFDKSLEPSTESIDNGIPFNSK